MLLNCGVGEDSWESLGLQGDKSWVFIGRTDAEAETPVLWPPHVKSWLTGKDPDAGRDWGQEEKGMTEDEIVGWHHWHNGHEFGWTLGVSDGQGGLACCGSWGCKESDMTEWLNWTELTFVLPILPGIWWRLYIRWLNVLKFSEIFFYHLTVSSPISATLPSMGFPGSSAGKESTCNEGDLDLIPGLGRSPGEGKAFHSSILPWRIPWTV